MLQVETIAHTFGAYVFAMDYFCLKATLAQKGREG